MPDEKKPWKDIISDHFNDTCTNARPKDICSIPVSKDVDEYREAIIRGYLEDTVSCLNSIMEKDVDKIKQIVDVLINVHDNNKKIITMGNGGSAAIASHMASDFSKAWLGDKLMRLRSFSLVDSVSQLTAWMNDSGYDQMFIGPLETILDEGDVVIGISGSGNSMNVVKALEFAKHKGAITIGFSGFNGGKIKEIVHYPFVVNSDSFKRIEDVHSTLGHMIKAVLVNELKNRSK